MSRALLCTQMGVALLIVCLVSLDVVPAAGKALNRHKRGFRTSSASRVAHGYGKRGFLSLPASGSIPLEQQEEVDRLLPKVSLADLAGLRQFPDEEEDAGSLATVEEFTELLVKHPSLARAVVEKFVDVDRDGVISTAELFRSTVRK